MKRRLQSAIALFGLLALVSAPPVAAQKAAPAFAPAEVTKVLDQAELAAKKEESLVRVDATGAKRTTRMHIMVVDRAGKVVGRRSMPDAWVGSIAIARSKAFTAVAFSSNENALTSRSLGALSQPGGPLWNIGNSNRQDGLIEFPGGVPLYKGSELVGAIGVSGDGVEQDEHVAVAGAKGFEAPAAIRVDTVTKNGVPYTK
ncbi:MAG TPA: heme-binding protein [Thermoanaerobaculia bacterium]|nr:heme-binding protein [Thermoanaerobaculia bacterium]